MGKSWVKHIPEVTTTEGHKDHSRIRAEKMKKKEEKQSS